MSGMRLIDADKLKIRETWALVENVSDTKTYDMGIVPKGISFAPLSCVLKKDIDDAPTIDAVVNTIEVRPRGKWILEEKNCDNGGNNLYQCSNCFYHDTHNDTAIVPYCWHCGAKMLKGGTE